MQTCKHISDLTRDKSIWIAILQHFAQASMPPFLHLLTDEFSHVLEPLAVYAYQFHAKKTSSLYPEITPASISDIWIDDSELDSHCLSEDARWLVEVRGRWSVRVWDLFHRNVYASSHHLAAEPACNAQGSAIYVSSEPRQVHVIVHGTRPSDNVVSRYVTSRLFVNMR